MYSCNWFISSFHFSWLLVAGAWGQCQVCGNIWCLRGILCHAAVQWQYTLGIQMSPACYCPVTITWGRPTSLKTLTLYLIHYLYRSIAEKGPTQDEKMASLEVTLSNYEAKVRPTWERLIIILTHFKVSGLENEIESQKEDYEKKLSTFADRLESIENSMKGAQVICLYIDTFWNIYQETSEERAGSSEKALLEELDKIKEEMRTKFTDVCTKVTPFWFPFISESCFKVDSLGGNLQTFDENGQSKFTKVEDNFNQLQTALRDIQQDNSRKIERVNRLNRMPNWCIFFR